MTPKDLPELTDVQASQNTDREVWRETPGDFYSNSVHLTATGGLGINVGGTVYVKPPAEWHRLASGARSTAAQPAGWKLLKDTTYEERSWPEDAAHENGNYSCCCRVCLRQFTGHKRRVVCKVCYADPAASGDSTPPSAPVQGDPSGALRPEPEAVDRERGVR